MTPEKARALLDAATPGPWEAYDPGDGTARLYSYANGADEADRLIGDLGEMEKGTGRLAAAAPELAETIANLRYEYAVAVPVATGVPDQPLWRYFIRRGADGGAILTALPGLGVWHVSEEGAAAFAEWHNVTGYRIARRFVGDPEVTE